MRIVLSAPVLKVPLAFLMPDQSPLAVQEVGLLVVVHVSTVDWPGRIGPTGFADKLTTGKPAGGSVTTRLAVVISLVPLALLHCKL